MAAAPVAAGPRIAPQYPDETDYGYAIRSGVEGAVDRNITVPIQTLGKNIARGFSTPASRAAEAGPAPKPAQIPGGSQPSQPSQGSGQQALAFGGWNPFADAAVAEGGGPGAPRDGGRRLHAGNAVDFSGMKVGTPIPAPPLGARLIEVGGTGEGNAGFWGKYEFADKSKHRFMHMAQSPGKVGQVFGPGTPLGFMGNTGNASTRGTDRAVAHMESWGPDGKPMDPRAYLGMSGGRPQAGPNQTRMEGAIAAAGGVPQLGAMDYSGVNKSLELQQQMLDNVKSPQTFSYTPPEYPDRPAPTPLQDINYAKADAAFEAARPKNPFGDTPEAQEKQKLSMRRASYWAGLGQAFANYKDGQGLGSLLANAGGSMLAGAMQGDENVRDKLEQFDKNLANFNLQLGNRENTKATNTANLINDNIRAADQHTASVWADKTNELKKLDVQFTPDGRAVYGKKNPDGTVTYTSELVNKAALNPILAQMGATHERKSAITNEATAAQQATDLATFKMILPAAFADATAAGDGKGAADTAYLAAQVAAYELTDGNTWRQVVEDMPNGKQAAAKLNYDAWKSVGVATDEETGEPIMGQSITTDQTNRYKSFLQNNLVQTFMETGNLHRLIGGWTEERYTDQEGMPKTGRRFYKPPDPTVGATILGNKIRDTKTSTRSTTKLPFGGSYSVSERE